MQNYTYMYLAGLMWLWVIIASGIVGILQVWDISPTQGLKEKVNAFVPPSTDAPA